MEKINYATSIKVNSVWVFKAMRLIDVWILKYLKYC